MNGIKQTVKSFIRERGLPAAACIGTVGIFLLVLFLYDVPREVGEYAAVLAAIWLIVLGILDFQHYNRRYRTLQSERGRILNDVGELPEPSGLPEQEYQEIVRELFEQRTDIESKARISRQETSEYYGMWVHQIKNPIAALKVLIQTYEERLQEQCAEADEEQRLLREMKMELFQIEQYVEMVLTYIRLEDISSDLLFGTFDLDDLIRSAVKKYSQMFILRNIRLHYEPTGEKVLTDEKWLVFVLEQILSNALKYIQPQSAKTADGTTEPDGQEPPRGEENSISIYMEEDHLVIEDTGIGIAAEDLPRVFEKGFTGYNGRADKKSTGIGLYLCKSVMDKLGHRIEIESEVGVGTKVSLYLKRGTLDTRE